MKVFVDTSAFVALRNRSDPGHASASAARTTLVDQRATLFTSNLVFAETYTALLVRVGYEEALRWGRAFRGGTAVELVRVDDEIEDDA